MCEKTADTRELRLEHHEIEALLCNASRTLEVQCRYRTSVQEFQRSDAERLYKIVPFGLRLEMRQRDL